MKKKLFFLSCLLIINIFLWISVFQYSSPYFKLTFINTGQGDSIFVRTPHNHHILIDGGFDDSALRYLDKKIPFWKKNLDLVILTHAHYDHYGGLIDIFQRYEVDKFLWNGVKSKNSSFLKLKEMIDSDIIIAEKGQTIRAGEVFLDILHPSDPGKYRDLNNTSVVTKVSYQDHSFLLTGDIYQEVEKKLKAKSDVLQVPHHGSGTSSSEYFLEMVNPQYAVISSGKDNPYGHPHNVVLQRLQKYDTVVLRTDLQGNIKFFSDGKKLKIKI